MLFNFFSFFKDCNFNIVKTAIVKKNLWNSLVCILLKATFLLIISL